MKSGAVVADRIKKGSTQLLEQERRFQVVEPKGFESRHDYSSLQAAWN